MSLPATAAVRALVLNRAHHCLLLSGRVPEATGPWPDRPLQMLREHVRDTMGITLPSPAGSRVPADGRGPRDFVFVMDAPPLPEGAPFSWTPLPRALDAAAAEQRAWIWETYVDSMLGGWEPPVTRFDVFFFGNEPELAAKLAHLVTCGEKRGTAAWLRVARLEGATVPAPGLVSIVTDGFGYPRCAVQTEEVRVVRFDQADEEAARLEGEGDLTLLDWKEVHVVPRAL
jgi:uncharacterized protein YhfF